MARRTGPHPRWIISLYSSGTSLSSLSTERLMTWKTVCTSRTCSTSSIQRDVIQAQGHSGSNQKSTVSTVCDSVMHASTARDASPFPAIASPISPGISQSSAPHRADGVTPT